MRLLFETIFSICIFCFCFVLADTTKNANLKKGRWGFILLIILLSSLIYAGKV